jgi:hypothetical protein
MIDHDPVNHRECELCKESIISKIDLFAENTENQVKSLRREIMIAVTTSTTLIGIFLLILAEVLKR